MIQNLTEEQKRYFSFNEEDTKHFIEQVKDWENDNSNPGKLIIVGNIPPVMKALGIADNLIEVEQSTLNKMVRDYPLYPTDKQGHEMTMDSIYSIPSELANPVMVFKSKARSDSFVFFTERKDNEGHSILIPMAVNKRLGRIVINEITSMYGKENEINFVYDNYVDDKMIYIDKSRSAAWAQNWLEKEKSSGGERYTKVQFLGQRFTDIETYKSIVLTKEKLVKFISSDSRNVKVQKMVAGENMNNLNPLNNISLEVVKSVQGFDNYKFSGKLTDEIKEYLHMNGYIWSKRNQCYYPASQEAKKNNATFTEQLRQEFFSGIEETITSEASVMDNRSALLEELISELRAQINLQNEKIQSLENKITELNEEKDSSKENNLSSEDAFSKLDLDAEILEKYNDIQEVDSDLSKEEVDVEVSPEELEIAKSVLPTGQYLTTLSLSQGEEGNFFKQKVKDIAAAVSNAPKIGDTDGMEQHPIILRYFHPTGTESFICELGENEAFGYQVINGNHEMAEFGYIDIEELKSIPMMEIDYHIPSGMSIEQYLYKENPEYYSKYSKFEEQENEEKKRNRKENVADNENHRDSNSTYKHAEETIASEKIKSSETDIQDASVRNIATANFVLDKIAAAGIEIVKTEEEYESIKSHIESNNIISQKLTMDWIAEREIDYSSVNQPGDIIPLLNNYNKTPQEMFLAVSLDAQHKPISCRIISVGTMNNALVHARDVFREAIKDNAAAVIISHNHPSGNTRPSDADVKTTEKLVNAGKILGIEVLDHIITAPEKNEYFSFLEHDMIQRMKNQGVLYGFVYDNKIYLDPNLINSEVAVHEYTHLWDIYTQKTNPELWEKGKDLFKQTYLWNEVINNPDYKDISNDENLVLSECHARITGKIASEILDRIAKENGNELSNAVIDWDKEVFEYCQNQFGFANKEFTDFISMTLKDLVDAKNIAVDVKQESIKHIETVLPENHHTKSEIIKIREQSRSILLKPDSEITEEDKLILSKYEGGGGLNEENRSTSAVLNEFYTPNNLIEKVWELADHYAPDAITVLEPSAGTGRFADNRPDNKFTMHELDETSAKINRILHPDATIIQGAYQKQFFDDGGRVLNPDYKQPKYDVVIGNPPYGENKNEWVGRGEGKEFNRIEEYFIAKGLDALKDENSILAYVVPSSFINTQEDAAKNSIAARGKIIDAYRLPSGVFPTTDVGTDIILFKKNTENDLKNGIAVAEEYCNGKWFINHPEKILG